jgi:hypothetical protein
MSTDKKPCSSCSTKLDLVPGDGSVKVVIKKFIKNSQIVKPRIEQLFNSKNNDYKMTSYLKTKPIINGKKISVEIIILQVISKYDTITKKYVLFSWFISTQTLHKDEKEIFLKFFKNPTKYINLKIAMIIIGKLITNNNLKITPKSQSTEPLSNCCNQDPLCPCNGIPNTITYAYPQSNGYIDYEYECIFGQTCYTTENGCKSISCSDVAAGVTYTGTCNDCDYA